jgi:hypothetical protein
MKSSVVSRSFSSRHTSRRRITLHWKNELTRSSNTGVAIRANILIEFLSVLINALVVNFGARSGGVLLRGPAVRLRSPAQDGDVWVGCCDTAEAVPFHPIPPRSSTLCRRAVPPCQLLKNAVLAGRPFGIIS